MAEESFVIMAVRSISNESDGFEIQIPRNNNDLLNIMLRTPYEREVAIAEATMKKMKNRYIEKCMRKSNLPVETSSPSICTEDSFIPDDPILAESLRKKAIGTVDTQSKKSKKGWFVACTRPTQVKY
jgi:hypothetical protein